METIEPLRYRGNEVVLFHLLDPGEIEPKLNEPVLLEDMETGDTMEASPDYASNDYRDKMAAHIDQLRSKTRGAGLGYFLVRTDAPLDSSLREYFRIRGGKT